MKNKKTTNVQPEKSKLFIDPKDVDIPKPDGETISSNEEDEENDKPGGNIFK
ncbi:hypothetical protein [Aquimarina longa]|uniref:hypothetical protein n=1 Tax=Aquimarina longa TaxID=1080221 RepID=UPI000A972F93|nr:hypothetical protein [Aquimarina longa]